MSHPSFPWEEPYMAAVCETDSAKMPSLIYEAVTAIEHRLLSPVEPFSDEDRALQNAQYRLATLRAERCASKSNGNGNGHF